MIKKLLLVGGGLLLWTTAKKKQMLQSLEYTFSSFKIHKWAISNPLSIETRLKLNVLNPSDTAQKIQNVFLKLYYKKAYVGYVQQGKEQEIKAQTANILDFPIQLTLFSLVQEIPNIIKAKGQLDGVLMEGFITASGVQIPVKKEINLTA